MSSGKLIGELIPGDLVILKGRRKKDPHKAAIIVKVLSDHDRILSNLLSGPIFTIWFTQKAKLYMFLRDTLLVS